jgi:hypothetical protein
MELSNRLFYSGSNDVFGLLKWIWHFCRTSFYLFLNRKIVALSDQYNWLLVDRLFDSGSNDTSVFLCVAKMTKKIRFLEFDAAMYIWQVDVNALI